MVIYDKEGNSYNPAIKNGRGFCPVCQVGKKTNASLSWNKEKEIGHCHKCDNTFFKEFIKQEKEFVKPEFKNNTSLSDKAVGWFRTRGISQFTLRDMKITEGLEWMPQKGKEVNTIQFNYFNDEELINTKFRTGDKNFKMVSGAELILYNLNAIKETEECIIVEGEMDALTLIECGFKHVVSVPNGANKKNNNLKYLDNCIEFFENKKKIIIATDNDIPGQKLRTELSARLGVEICYKIDFAELKDFNDVLVNKGKDEVISILSNAVAFPIDGVYSATDYINELTSLYENGMQKGLTIDNELDEFISFETQRLYTITGIPGHGKSEFLDFIIERLNIKHGIKTGYFTPENRPLQLHIAKMSEKIIGKSFSKEWMKKEEFEMAINHIKENFFYIEPKDNFSLETILQKARHLVFTKGIKALIIDPYNKLEHNITPGQSETNYISKFLDVLINFAIRNNIMIFLVAHPTKIPKENKKFNVPTLYDIAGSAHFYNKTDFGICVYRDKETNIATVHIQKVKFKHLGTEGTCPFEYNVINGRYTFYTGESDTKGSYENHLIIKKEVEEIEEIEKFDFTKVTEIPF